MLLQQDVVGSLCILNLCSNLGISDFTKKSCFVLVESDTGNKNWGVQDASFYWDVTAPRVFQTERATMLVCLLYRHEFITISNIKSPKVKKKKKSPKVFSYSILFVSPLSHSKILNSPKVSIQLLICSV